MKNLILLSWLYDPVTFENKGLEAREISMDYADTITESELTEYLFKRLVNEGAVFGKHNPDLYEQNYFTLLKDERETLGYGDVGDAYDTDHCCGVLLNNCYWKTNDTREIITGFFNHRNASFRIFNIEAKARKWASDKKVEHFKNICPNEYWMIKDTDNYEILYTVEDSVTGEFYTCFLAEVKKGGLNYADNRA